MKLPKAKFSIGEVVWFNRLKGTHNPFPSRVLATVESIEFIRVRGAEPLYRLSGGWLNSFGESELNPE